MRECIGVTELNEYLQRILESDDVLNNIYVRGEISNFKNHSSGHCYFSLKDENGAVRAVMFRSYAARLRFLPENGMKVIVHGRVSVFPRSGDYQIYVDGMEPDGIGALALAFEQLRKKLESEGLFDASKKREIPRFPQKIGIVTSPTGAAVRDMLQILGRRYPLAEVILFPALVQGPEAPADLIRGLAFFAEEMPVDVILIGRGGGSMEDLWCFNYENLVRAIAASPIPVISAVGHETDFTLSDFAADLRAPTPSAAAELAVPDIRELLRYVEGLGVTLSSDIETKLDTLRAKISGFAGLLSGFDPIKILENKRMLVGFFENRLAACGENMTAARRLILSALSAKMETLNPVSVLSRGYGIVYDKNGHTVCSPAALAAGDDIRVRVRDGDILAVVKNGDKA